MNLLDAYAKIYAAGLIAYRTHNGSSEKADRYPMPQARVSARNCVDDFRQMIRGMPEFKEFFDRPIPVSNAAENPEAGKF